MHLQIGERSYQAIVEDSPAAGEFLDLLPLTMDMHELCGSLKYGDLPLPLAQNDAGVLEIQAGDLLLWGADTLVLVYRDLPPKAGYTRLARIEESESLCETLGTSSTEVMFEQNDFEKE